MGTHKINVQAVNRPEGYDAFFRGGHRFTTDGADLVVTDALYRLIMEEPNLRVTPAPAADGEPLDVIDNRSAAFLAVPAETRERARNDVLKRRIEAIGLARENKELEAQLAELEAEEQANAPAPSDGFKRLSAKELKKLSPEERDAYELALLEAEEQAKANTST